MDVGGRASVARQSGRPGLERLARIFLGSIFLFRLAFCALVYERPQLAIANDSDRYVPLANAILDGQGYGWNTDHPGELLNTAGYPLFLTGAFLVLGHNAGDVALAQLLATGSAALILYVLLLRRTGPRAAFLAAIMLLLDPLTILWSMTILTEAVFAAALGVSAVLLAAWAYSQNRWTLVLAGLFGALASLVKPLALPILAVWFVGLTFFPTRGGGPASRRMIAVVVRGLIFVLPTIILVGPWFVRNQLLWNCPTLASVDRVTLRDYMAAKVLAEVRHEDLEAIQAELQAQDPGVCPIQSGKYLQILRDHPATYARLHAAGTVPVLFATNFDRWLQYFGLEYALPDLWRPYLDGGWTGIARVLGEQMRDFPGAIALMLGLMGFQVVLYLLATAGVFSTLRGSSRPAKWIVALLVTAIAVLVFAPGQGGHERFRVPVQPMLAILVAHGGAVYAARTGLGRDAGSPRVALKSRNVP